MSISFNKLILAGYLTRDPDLKYLPSGTSVCNYGIAVNSKYGDREDVLFMNVVAFNKVAEISNQYLSKGAPVLLEGRLQCRDWTDSEGRERKSYEIVVNTMQMLGGKSESSEREAPVPDDDIPF